MKGTALWKAIVMPKTQLEVQSLASEFSVCSLGLAKERALNYVVLSIRNGFLHSFKDLKSEAKKLTGPWLSSKR